MNRILLAASVFTLNFVPMIQGMGLSYELDLMVRSVVYAVIPFGAYRMGKKDGAFEQSKGQIVIDYDYLDKMSNGH